MSMPVHLLLFIFTISQGPHRCQSKLHSPATITSNNGNNDGDTSPIPTFTLANNITIPLVGLGSASGVAFPHVQSAIEAGYRFVDTAQSHSWGYREEDVGEAVRVAKRRYEDWSNGDADDYVFVQTKIHPQDLGYHSTQKAIQLSLSRLQVTSLDSVLIHKPRCWEGVCSHEPEGTWQDSWTALEEAVDSGIVRSIGICDVDERLLNELVQKRIPPMVIQNWFDPFHQDKDLRRRVERHNEQHLERQILYQGYSSLGTQWYHFKGYDKNPVLNHHTLQSIAERHRVTVPQVVIQWATRRGVMALPASRNRSHQTSNLNSFHFVLEDKEMVAIDVLDGNPPPLPKERNLNEVQLQFVNRVEGSEGPVNVFWVPDEGDHIHVGEMKELGDMLKVNSYHGHAFVFKDSSKILNYHLVDRSLGPDQNIDIGESTEEL